MAVNQQQLIRQLAMQSGVDPRAALAIASVEGGFNGAVGDNGTSFGPFQMHVGGALPQGRGNQWANSPAGIQYAMQHIASVAKGLHGRQAVSAISSRFERPANIPAEIQKAMSRYGGVSGGGGGRFPMPSAPSGGSPGGGDMSSMILSLVQNILASNASQQSLAPQTDPLVVRYGLNA